MTWPDAVLWDMDGTLIDSERAWLDAALAIAARHGITLDHTIFDLLVGASMPTTAGVLREAGIPGDDDAIIAELTSDVHRHLREHVVFRPGALALACEIEAAGIPQAIVSMSHRVIVEHVASIAPVDLASIAGDDVSNGKPHPESYLTAAARLGVAIEDCVVLEDSAIGLAAGVASGAVAIAVPLYLPVDASAAAAEWDGFTGRTLADLRRHGPTPASDSPAHLTAPTSEES